MRRDIGKMRVAALIGFIALFGLSIEQIAAAQPNITLNAGFINAWTKISSSDIGHHLGWSVVTDANWNFSIPLGAPTGVPHAGLFLSLAPGLRSQYLDIGASNWLSDGSRYRAWNALGVGPELSLGLTIAGSGSVLSQTISVDGAFLANFCNYTDTTLYTAYTSWLVGAGWTMNFNSKWSITAQVPIEFAARADGNSIIAGICVGGRYAF